MNFRELCQPSIALLVLGPSLLWWFQSSNLAGFIQVSGETKLYLPKHFLIFTPGQGNEERMEFLNGLMEGYVYNQMQIYSFCSPRPLAGKHHEGGRHSIPCEVSILLDSSLKMGDWLILCGLMPEKEKALSEIEQNMFPSFLLPGGLTPEKEQHLSEVNNYLSSSLLRRGRKALFQKFPEIVPCTE